MSTGLQVTQRNVATNYVIYISSDEHVLTNCSIFGFTLHGGICQKSELRVYFSSRKTDLRVEVDVVNRTNSTSADAGFRAIDKAAFNMAVPFADP